MMNIKKFFSLLVILILTAAACVTLAESETEFKRIVRGTPAYLEPTEEEIFQSGYFITESNVIVRARLENGWVEIEYYCDPTLHETFEDQYEPGERYVYIKEDALLNTINNNAGLSNLIVPQEILQAISHNAKFIPELLLDLQYSTDTDESGNDQLTFTSRNRAIGKDADPRDILLMQTQQPYIHNSRFIFIPEIKVGNELQYPVDTLSYNLLGREGIEYSVNNDFITDPKVLAGLRFILENSPPYKIYTGYTTDYKNASRYAAAVAIHDYLAETAGIDSKYNLYDGVEAYNSETFSADYFGYAYWLYENAIALRTQYEDQEMPFISCDVLEAPVMHNGNLEANIRIITNAEEGWKIPKDSIPEEVLYIENANENSMAYYGEQGAVVVKVISSKASIGKTIEIPLLFNTDDPIVQFSEAESGNLPVVVSLSKQNTERPPKQIQIVCPAPTKVAVSIKNETSGEPLDNVEVKLLGNGGESYTAETAGGQATFNCIPDIYTYSINIKSKEYQQIPSGEIDAFSDAEIALSTSEKYYTAHIRITNSFTGELIRMPCDLEIYAQSDPGTPIFKGTVDAGEVTLERLSPGLYTAKQLTEFKGYEATEAQTFTIDGEDVQADVKSDPITGYITGQVLESGNDKPVPGAELEIMYNGNAVMECVTAEDGTFETGKLPTGDYTVELKKLPDGYRLKNEQSATTRCKVAYKRSTLLKWIVRRLEVTITVYPREQSQIKSYKARRIHQTGICDLTACTYQLVAGEGNSAFEPGEVVAEFPPVNTNGKQTSITFNHAGNYIIQETGNGTGYLHADDIEITIDEKQKKYDVPVLKTPGSKSVRIMKTDGLGSAEPGATFHIFRTEYPGYKKAPEDSRYSVETGEDGTAVIAALPYGDWTIMNAASEQSATEIVVNNESPDPILALFNGEDKSHYIKILVQDEDGKKIRKEAGFAIIRDGAEQETITVTGEKLVETPLPHGEYMLRQTETADEYLPAEDLLFTIGETDPVIKEITAENRQRDKSMSISAYIAGSPVTYVDNVKIIVKEDLLSEPLLSMSSSRNGSFITTPMPLKKYIILAGNLPEGYSAAENPIVVDLKKGTDNIVPVGIRLIPDQTVIVYTPTEQQNSLQYGLYRKAGANTSPEGEAPASPVLSVKKAYDGKVIFSGRYDYGEYYIAPVSMGDFNPSPAFFEITSSKRFMSVSQPANDCFSVHIETLDCETGLPVENAYVRLENNGAVCFEGYIPEGGTFLPLEPGTYILRSVLAPSRYAYPENTNIFTVEQDGTITGSTSIEYELNAVEICVEDKNGEAVSKAEFVLTNTDTKQTRHAVADSNGLVSFTGVEFGNYEIREYLPAPGYAANRSIMRVRLDGLYRNKKANAVIQSDVNCLYFKVTDIYGDPIKNAELTLLNSQGSVLQNALTSDDGVTYFTAIPFGAYKVRMVGAPDHYLKSNTEYDLIIGNNDDSVFSRMPRFVCVPRNASFTLVNINGKGVQSARFEMIDKSTAETIEVQDTDISGRFSFTKFGYGEYLIRQTASPSGNAKIDDIEFDVDEQWRPTDMLLRTSYDFYEFIVMNNHGEKLEGIPFRAVNTETGEEAVAESDKNGVVRFEGLRAGDYKIQPAAGSEAYEAANEVINVHIDELYMPAETLYLYVLKEKTEN